MLYNYPKKEKLKKRKDIEYLYLKGKIAVSFPLKIIYVPTKIENSSIKFGVTVSKKNFKRAVDRNALKRLQRECYRRNKSLLLNSLNNEPHYCMLSYIGKERITFEQMENSFKKLLKIISEV